MLSAIALTTGAVITYHLVDDFLLQRLDQQLETEGERLFNHMRAVPNTQMLTIASGGYADVFVPEGGSLRIAPIVADDASIPRLPTTYKPGQYWFTTSSQNGPDYRIFVESLPLEPVGSGTFVYGRPLSEVTATLKRLVLIEISVSSSVLILVGTLAFFAIRLGLRPLEQVIDTADAIANGDLSRRVPEESPRTEVGRLGLAFNSMLAAIQQSFTRQQEVEHQLRTFVADASHELRTPLTPMRGYLELLGRSELTDEDRIFAMERVRASTDRMQRLVDDLLLLARLDAQPSMNIEDVNLSRVVEDALVDHRTAAPERPLTAEIASDVYVYGDPDHLARVIVNLLANIRIHTPPGTATAVRLYEDEDEAFLEISDRGPGIPEDASRHLFDRFYRVDQSRGSVQGGSGLGLSIVAAIVRMHDGEISMESETRKGTTFQIIIPLATADRSPDA